MHYTPYNPYTYGQYSPQQGLPPAYMPQAVQMQQQNQQPIQGLSAASRPVTSREEANGVAADFSGSLMVFPDITHDRVYIKRWDVNAGAAQFQEYAPAARAQQQAEQPRQDTPAAFASLQDFQDLKGLVENLRQEIDALKRPGEAKSQPPARAVKKEKQDADS